MLQPSSPEKGEEVGEVLTPKKFPQLGNRGALTQRRVSEYLTPVRNKVEPRAEVQTNFPPTEGVIKRGPIGGAVDGGGGG